jgi:hypothetical protein
MTVTEQARYEHQMMCAYCGLIWQPPLWKRSPCCGECWYEVPDESFDPDTAWWTETDAS